MFVEVCLLKYENRMKNIYWNAAKGYPRIQVQNRAEKNYKNSSHHRVDKKLQYGHVSIALQFCTILD